MTAFLTVPLDPAAESPLFRQLYDGIRGSILAGVLPAGMRLPATRGLAVELGVSRNTVMNAYEQLLAEGYLEGRHGSGTFVPRTLPEELLQVPSAASSAIRPRRQSRSLSQRGQLLAGAWNPVSRPSGPPRPFRPGIPDFDEFPFETWTRLVTRHCRRPTREQLSYGDPAGYLPLRKAIAHHLGPARAVHCDPDQVIILAGAQQGLDLAARLLLDAGDEAWVEEPGYPSARAALAGAGVRLVPVPVDEAGLDVARGEQLAPRARLVHVTPSHQYPLGVTMTLPRRLALLDWARRANAWIVEDDYDSEFRYAGRPLAALQGLDRHERVLYIGTFSKVLFPSIRLGYLVAPPDLVDAFARARAVTDRQASTLTQAVVADFIHEGHFARHIRRMRKLYAERQDVLLRAAQDVPEIDVRPCETGLHVVGWLTGPQRDRAVSRAAARRDVDAAPLSAYYAQRCPRQGLMLGYAGCDAAQIRGGMRALATAVRESDGRLPEKPRQGT